MSAVLRPKLKWSHDKFHDVFCIVRFSISDFVKMLNNFFNYWQRETDYSRFKISRIPLLELVMRLVIIRLEIQSRKCLRKSNLNEITCWTVLVLYVYKDPGLFALISEKFSALYLYSNLINSWALRKVFLNFKIRLLSPNLQK